MSQPEREIDADFRRALFLVTTHVNRILPQVRQQGDGGIEWIMAEIRAHLDRLEQVPQDEVHASEFLQQAVALTAYGLLLVAPMTDPAVSG